MVREKPNALRAGTVPGRLELLRSSNALLDTVQKNLESYLETKRVAFPRFYFISSDELLHILSQRKNPTAVQPHLQKCFEGLRRLEFSDAGQSPDILAMVSVEGERIAPLGKNLKARGSVEGTVWAAVILFWPNYL